MSTVVIDDCEGNNNGYGVAAAYGAVVTQKGPTVPGKRIRGTVANTYTVTGGIITPTETWANITLYVRPDGSDDNDGSANDAANALKTIQEAISRLPKRIDHTVTINVAAGVYDEAVSVNGFTGAGSFNFIGGISVSDDYVINSIAVSSCTCRVYVKGLKGTATTVVPFTGISSYVLFDFCKVDIVTAAYAGVSISYGTGRISNCSISNRLYGISAGITTVYSHNNTGAGNTYGLYAHDGAQIGKYSTQPAGTTAAEYATAGGVIR
jgi:hypothetical protein